MSNRFKNLLTRWASGNFSSPGKPWDTTTKQATPAFDGFEPDTVYTAQNVNSVLDQRFAEANTSFQGLYDMLQMLQFTRCIQVSFGANITLRRIVPEYSTVAVNWFVLARNDNTGYWYLARSDAVGGPGGTVGWGTLYDNAATDPTSVGNFSSSLSDLRAIAVTVSPTTILFSHGATAGKIKALAGNTWTEYTHGEGTLNGAGFTAMLYRNTNSTVLLVGSTGSATKACSFNGSTFTSLTSTLPAALASLTSPGFVGGTNYKTGDTVVFAAQTALTTYMSLAAGSSTWGSGTSPVGTNEGAVAVCCDGDYWYLATYNATTTVSKIYVMAVGSTTWTLRKTFNSTYQITSIAADYNGTLAATFLAVYSLLNTPSGTSAYDACFVSVDQGYNWLTNGARATGGVNTSLEVVSAPAFGAAAGQMAWHSRSVDAVYLGPALSKTNAGIG